MNNAIDLSDHQATLADQYAGELIHDRTYQTALMDLLMEHGVLQRLAPIANADSATAGALLAESIADAAKLIGRKLAQQSPDQAVNFDKPNKPYGYCILRARCAMSRIKEALRNA